MVDYLSKYAVIIIRVYSCLIERYEVLLVLSLIAGNYSYFVNIIQ
jgi:hypothetical protein